MGFSFLLPWIRESKRSGHMNSRTGIAGGQEQQKHFKQHADEPRIPNLKLILPPIWQKRKDPGAVGQLPSTIVF